MFKKLKYMLLFIGVISFVNVFAESNDYSKSEDDLYRPEYNYNPFIDSNIPQYNKIENNILPGNTAEQSDFWDNPRKLYLKRASTGETIEVVYYSNGKINPKDYHLASYMLRDQKQNQMVYVDPKLLDLLCAVQAWLRYSGYNGPIVIHSGFRTKKTNNRLEGAAKKSMHLYGKAVDFSIPGVKSTVLAKIATQFKAGGIGIYKHQNFLHLDTGGVRTWTK